MNHEIATSVTAGEALRDAATTGNLSEVLRLLTSGVDPDSASIIDGYTPLQFASIGGHTLVVKALIEHGAAANNFHNDVSASALGQAAVGGHLGIVRYLLQNGATLSENEIHTNLLDEITGFGFPEVAEAIRSFK